LRISLLLVVMTFEFVIAAPLAGGEQLLVKGMGQTVGWVVATDAGEIRFRDCRGDLTTLQDGRVELTIRRCPAGAGEIELVGTVKHVDAAARILLAEDAAGHVHGFFLDEALDPRILAGIAAGQPVRVSGPVPGRATRIQRPRRRRGRRRSSAARRRPSVVGLG
jgi:hypothetical protein